MKHIPGIDMSSGSLGQGISAAVGMALAAKLDNKSYRVYTLLGDGEIQEGQVWEASMFAGASQAGQPCSDRRQQWASDRWKISKMYALRIRLTRNLRHLTSM